MTTDSSSSQLPPELPKRSSFTRAEGVAREAAAIIGSGVLGYVVGAGVGNSFVASLTDTLADVESTAVVFIIVTVLSRIWLFAVMPLLGLVAGRFLEVRPWSYAFVACASGELFDWALSSALHGVSGIIDTWWDVAARIVTFAIGVVLTAFAARSQRRVTQ